MTSAEYMAEVALAALPEQAASEGVEIDLDNAPMSRALLKSIMIGVYAGMQLLDDITGQPPSVGHR